MTESLEPFRTNEARQALLEQLAHLGDEVAALKRHVELIPDEVLEGRPLDADPSFKEIYGLLIAYDERVYGPAVRLLTKSGGAQVDLPKIEDMLEETVWNELAMDEIIDRVRVVRSNLVKRLDALSLEAWRGEVAFDGDATDVFGLAYRIIQHDAELLRTAAYRLHESRLTSRDEDLPK